MALARRAVLAATASTAMGAMLGCRRCGEDAALPPETAPNRPRPSAPAPLPNAGEWRELSWTTAEAPPEGEAALVRRGDKADSPLIVALHGRGESGRGLLAGAAGFRDDYAIEEVEKKLLGGTISAADLGGFATNERIAALQRSLGDAAYEKPALVTPYCPVLSDRSVAGARGFTTFVCDTLLARAASAIGHDVPHARRGIDGISMGGRLALQIAITRPEVFATVGAMQPAISVDETSSFASAIAAAHARSPFTLRLVSSKDDPFLDAVRALDRALSNRSIPHLFIVTPGPHDYAWNRGPGAAELLMFHERALRGMTPP
jgi:pimeloyl-ACP methyl ester carboxylesterase